MQSELEKSFADICKKHGFTAFSIGIHLECSADGRWTANAHWGGYSRDGNPCTHGFGATIAEAVAKCIERARECRRPPSGDALADEALPAIVA